MLPLLSRNACKVRMAKNSRRLAIQIGCQKWPLTPLERGDFGNFGKIANLDGKKLPEGWRFELEGKSGPLKSCDLGNGSFVL